MLEIGKHGFAYKLPGEEEVALMFDSYEKRDEFAEKFWKNRELADVEWYEEDVFYENAPAEQLVFVNVYTVTREFGGHEEGGWWYNRFQCVESVPVQNQYSETMMEYMDKKWAHEKYGNIYSVLGGQDVEVYIEATPSESETKERPHYE